MADPFNYQYHMISPPIFVLDAQGEGHTVFGWREDRTRGKVGLEPVVRNPDGPGIGPWSWFFGDDPWHTG